MKNAAAAAAVVTAAVAAAAVAAAAASGGAAGGGSRAHMASLAATVRSSQCPTSGETRAASLVPLRAFAATQTHSWDAKAARRLGGFLFC